MAVIELVIADCVSFAQDSCPALTRRVRIVTTQDDNRNLPLVLPEDRSWLLSMDVPSPLSIS